MYRSLLGPTPDEVILAGLQTIINMCFNEGKREGSDFDSCSCNNSTCTSLTEYYMKQDFGSSTDLEQDKLPRPLSRKEIYKICNPNVAHDFRKSKSYAGQGSEIECACHDFLDSPSETETERWKSRRMSREKRNSNPNLPYYPTCRRGSSSDRSNSSFESPKRKIYVCKRRYTSEKSDFYNCKF